MIMTLLLLGSSMTTICGPWSIIIPWILAHIQHLFWEINCSWNLISSAPTPFLPRNPALTFMDRFLSDEEEILSRRGTLKMMMMEQQVTVKCGCMQAWIQTNQPYKSCSADVHATLSLCCVLPFEFSFPIWTNMTKTPNPPPHARICAIKWNESQRVSPCHHQLTITLQACL